MTSIERRTETREISSDTTAEQSKVTTIHICRRQTARNIAVLKPTEANEVDVGRDCSVIIKGIASPREVTFNFYHGDRHVLDFEKSNRSLMTQIEVPNELPIILRDFTLSVLRTKPSDIVDHAVQYFTQLRQQSSVITDDNNGTTVSYSLSHTESHHPPARRNVAFAGQYFARASDLWLFNVETIIHYPKVDRTHTIVRVGFRYGNTSYLID
jgi:hypothetical protein